MRKKLTSLNEYNAWRLAKSRCNDINHHAYSEYGARGIKFFFNSVLDIIEDIGYKPEPKNLYTIDRIDNNGNYEKGNVRWATRTEQQRNRRSNHLISYKGETKCLTEWCNILQLPRGTLVNRIYKNKWCLDCAFGFKSYEGKCKHR